MNLNLKYDLITNEIIKPFISCKPTLLLLKVV